MMEVGYRLEQSIERLCAFQICDNHTTFLQLLAAFAVAVAAVQTTQFLPCYPSVSFAILHGLQKQPFHLTSVVPSTKLVSELSWSWVEQASWRRQAGNRKLTLLLQPIVNGLIAGEI